MSRFSLDSPRNDTYHSWCATQKSLSPSFSPNTAFLPVYKMYYLQRIILIRIKDHKMTRNHHSTANKNVVLSNFTVWFSVTVQTYPINMYIPSREQSMMLPRFVYVYIIGALWSWNQSLVGFSWTALFCWGKLRILLIHMWTHHARSCPLSLLAWRHTVAQLYRSRQLDWPDSKVPALIQHFLEIGSLLGFVLQLGLSVLCQSQTSRSAEVPGLPRKNCFVLIMKQIWSALKFMSCNLNRETEQ